MNFEAWFSSTHPTISVKSAAAVLELSSEGATVPFIARYRKEKTGNLDEVAIRDVVAAKETWDETIKRQIFILSEIEKQGKLTPTLRDRILDTYKLEILEDLYLPYKLKRKTKAAIARESGLEPLAEWIWACAHPAAEATPSADASTSLDAKAAGFVDAEKKVPDAAAAIQGAQDIIVERLSETLPLREYVRKRLFENGFVKSKKGEKAKSPSQYENYFDYAETVKSLHEPKNSHRYLALRRGWTEEEIVLQMGGGPQDEKFEDTLVEAFQKEAASNVASPGAAVLGKAARLAYKAHVFPAIESEVHKSLKEHADADAIQVFAENVANLLLSAPFGPKAVLGVDPGIRSGCKLAVVESSGRFAAHELMHLQSDGEKKRSKDILLRLVRDHKVRAVAVGNGTAGRETETFVRDTLKEGDFAAVPVVMVSESGASVYSASDVAREEFPELDVTVRGAISIARRLQDPLAELVKVDPKSIGVGQYQHDVAAAALKKSLNEVVDSCVNRVGVNLNTASQHLLARVSGIGSGLAKAVVDHRGTHGLFKSRTALLEVSRFTKKSFEQSAGFLRISEGDNPLDNTGVHPERYPLLEGLAEKLGKQVRDLLGEGVVHVRGASELKTAVGEFTHQDIVAELEKPGRDPREEFVPFSFREDIHELKDLKLGLQCPGIVTNVTNFGAFVDIGVHQDGLVHISQLADHFVKDPREVVKSGDRVMVRVLDVKLDKKQISLSMKSPERPAPQQATRPRQDMRPQQQHPQQHRSGPPPQRDQHDRRPNQGRPHDRRPQGRPAALDPNNPFHKLAALKGLLSAPPSKKKS